MPTFTMDYAGSNAKVWQRLFRVTEWNPKEKKIIVEIGSYEGSSALWFANNLLQHPESVLYCLDIWSRLDREAVFRSNIAEYPGPARIVPMKARSEKSLMTLIGQGVLADLVYVDGNHAAPGVLTDLVLSFQLVRVGGLVICDDYTWADPKHGGAQITGRPKIAIDAFTTIYSDKIRILREVPIKQVAFVKLGD